MGKTVSFKIYAFIAFVLLVLTAGMMNVPTAHADEEKTVDIDNITIDQIFQPFQRFRGTFRAKI